MRIKETIANYTALLAVLLASTALARAAQNHSASGILIQVDAAYRSIVVSCNVIPGYMDAMEMAFKVPASASFNSLKPGQFVRFVIVKKGSDLYAESIQPGSGVNSEAEPMEAGGLSALSNALNADAIKVLLVGQSVPDFTLIDQIGKTIRLSQFKGKVVALTFGYSRCPNPQYCFRLSNNLALVEKRFRMRAGSDLILLTIAIDPEHDHGRALALYANTWKANPSDWHFLTGPLPRIQQVAQMFGMNFWYSEGVLTHSLHTIIIDRNGRLTANLEGNSFTSQQLGDLIQSIMDRSQAKTGYGAYSGIDGDAE